MKQLDLEQASWIKGHPIGWNMHIDGVVIANCMPDNFESYCKIFHPFRIAPVQVGGGAPETITWAEVGEKYGIPFHNQTSAINYINRFKEIGRPENLFYPVEGQMPLTILSILLDILKQYTSDNQVRIYQHAPNSGNRWGKAVDLVECGLQEVLLYFDKYFIGHLFARDRSWVVYTDTDLDCTIVGGSAALIQALLSSPLEVLKCTALTLVSNTE